MFDPTSGPVPPVDFEQMKRLFGQLRELRKGAGQVGENQSTPAIGLGAIAAPIPELSPADIQALMFRCALLGLALSQQDEFADFQHGDDVDEGLLRLFATFPFRADNVQPDGSFQLNKEEFAEELQKLAKPAR